MKFLASISSGAIRFLKRFVILLTSCIHLCFAQTPNSIPVTRVLFILDASSSMDQQWDPSTKIDAAKKIILQLTDSLEGKSNIEVALRVYGHQSINTQQDCNDTKLEVPFGSDNLQKIKQVLATIRPKGITPMALSLQNAAHDFPNDSHAKNFIVLVTDGAESCNGDPCAVSIALRKEKISLKPFIIGFNLNPALDSVMECTGNYFNAKDQQAIKEILPDLLQRILSNTSLQVNLLDASGKPLETDVNISLYDTATGTLRYDFYHTLNYRGISDTVQADPSFTYNLIVHTIPPIRRENLNFAANKKNVVDIPASQGFLKLQLAGSTINNNLNQKIKCIVRKAGSSEEVVISDINNTEKLLSGSYDLEFLTLPRIQINDVKITQSATTTIQIETPGVLSVTKNSPAYTAIFLVKKNEWIKIYDLNDNLTNEFIGLQPGNYTVVYRSEFSKKTTDTRQKNILITSGKTTSLTL